VKSSFRETVQLLLSVAPYVFRVPDFAMKGGTAINFFVRDMPRLSVDIDVAYTRVDVSREAALAAISTGLDTIAKAAKRQGLTARIARRPEVPESKIFLGNGSTQVTVEVNTVARGTVLPAERHELRAAAQSEFRLQLEVPILAPAELFGGKLVAALDRQHPRDLFDVLLLMRSEGLTPDIVRCFVIYLASHNRPMHEVLHPNPKDLTRIYENDFVGMTNENVSLEELLALRDALPHQLSKLLSREQRHFLMTLARGEPDWKSAGVEHADRLPAIQWKLDNIRKLANRNPKKHEEQSAALNELLQT